LHGLHGFLKKKNIFNPGDRTGMKSASENNKKY